MLRRRLHALPLHAAPPGRIAPAVSGRSGSITGTTGQMRYALLLAATLVAAACRSAPGGWYPADMDTAGVEVPPSLAGLCSPGPRLPFPPEDARPARSPRDRRREMPIHLVHGSYYSGIEQPLRCVIRTAGEWRAFWAATTSNEFGTSTPLPEVDFRQDMLLAATMGSQGTTGHGITIHYVLAGEDSLTAVVRRASGLDGCEPGEMVTTPVHVIRVPRTERPVRFLEFVAKAPDCA